MKLQLETEKNLRVAASTGEINLVRKLLKTEGINVNSTSTNGYTALDWVIHKRADLKNKVLPIVLDLLASGARNIHSHTLEILNSLAINPLISIIKKIISSIGQAENAFPLFNKFQFNCLNIDDFEEKEQEIALYAQYQFSFLFLNVFSTNFNKSFSDKTNKELNVISFGCGNSHELIPLLYMADAKKIKVNFVGVDIEPEYILYCKKIFKNLNNMNFILADACKLDDLVSTHGIKPNSFDLVFLRNPNLQSLQSVFMNIINNIIPIFIKKNGSLYCSLYGGDFNIFKQSFSADEFFLNSEFISLSKPLVIQSVDGNNMTPDQFTYIGNLQPKIWDNKESQRAAATLIYRKTKQQNLPQEFDKLDLNQLESKTDKSP